MKKIYRITFLSVFLSLLLASCETTELELLNNPNDITVESADANFVLNDIQLAIRNVYNDYNGPSMAVTRMINQFGSYGNTVDDVTLSGTGGAWAQSYQMFANIDLLQGINEELADEGGVPNHVGVAQILEAYTYMLLVDYLGDVPFSQANKPEEFPTPAPDPGATVYDAQIELLDQAIANLSQGSPVEPTDLFFESFDANNWIAVANSLKIRAYNNIRLVEPSRATSSINALLSANILDENDEDFQFRYGDVNTPESRHPLFTGNYLNLGVQTYMSNQFYDYLNAGDADQPFVETGEPDPRLRYYIYRQTDSPPSGSNLPCAGDGNYDYCYVGNLYWGRDHADEAGLPNDATRKSGYGIYPIGGAFDMNQFVRTVATENLGGAGILPIYLASFTHFTLAEASLTIGVNGSPSAYLEEGIRLSLDKVQDFADGVDKGDFAMTQADKDDYVSRVLTEFNAANNARKLEIIEREYMLAAWGNGIEPYNNYRRTGYPELQDPIIPAGPFPRLFRIPFNEVENNPNLSQNQNTDQVFWDNNPSSFID
jgi:hypothetical protein